MCIRDRIKESFNLKGKGVILSLNLHSKNAVVLIGDRIKLIKPNDEELLTKVYGLAYPNGNFDIMIESIYSEEDIPSGTEVWLLNQLD